MRHKTKQTNKQKPPRIGGYQLSKEKLEATTKQQQNPPLLILEQPNVRDIQCASGGNGDVGDRVSAKWVT